MNELEQSILNLHHIRQYLHYVIKKAKINTSIVDELNALDKIIEAYGDDVKEKFKLSWDSCINPTNNQWEDAYWRLRKNSNAQIHDLKAKLSRALDPNNPNYTDDEIEAMSEEFMEDCLTLEKFMGDKHIWESKVELDGLTGDLYIQFPDDLMQKLGWKEGDILNWEIADNKTVILTKKNGK